MEKLWKLGLLLGSGWVAHFVSSPFCFPGQSQRGVPVFELALPPPTGDEAATCPSWKDAHRSHPFIREYQGQGEPLWVAQPLPQTPQALLGKVGTRGLAHTGTPPRFSVFLYPSPCAPNSHRRRMTLTGWCCSMPPAPEARPPGSTSGGAVGSASQGSAALSAGHLPFG